MQVSSDEFMFHCYGCNILMSFRIGDVPDILLITIELPDSIQITGRGCFVQAQVCRTKKDLKSESNAKEISDAIPFLEYEIHRLLVNKIKSKGMNALFGMKVSQMHLIFPEMQYHYDNVNIMMSNTFRQL